MTDYYLAETRREPGTAPALQVFDAAELCEFLARTVEDIHYSGYGPDLLAQYRYDSGGTLTPLAMHQTSEDRDPGDWLCWHFEVCAVGAMHADGGHVAEAAFTVRIDGRA